MEIPKLNGEIVNVMLENIIMSFVVSDKEMFSGIDSR